MKLKLVFFSIFIFLNQYYSYSQSVIDGLVINSSINFSQPTEELIQKKDTLLLSLGLTNIKESKHKFVFREFMDNLIIEVWSDDSVNFSGVIYMHTIAVTPNSDTSEFIKGKTFKKQIVLNEKLSKRIFQAFISNNINLVKGYSRDLSTDGSVVDFHIKQNEILSAFEIREQAYYETYPVRVEYDKFVKSINKVVDLKKEIDKFFSELPKGCYKSNSYFMRCKSH